MDDDFVINFSAPAAGVTAVRATKKGGRWTDRVKDKRAAQATMRKAQPKAPAAVSLGKRPRDVEDAGEEERSPPKPKTPGGGGARPSNAPAPPSAKQVIGLGGKKQYISSLFTAEDLPAPAVPASIIIPSRPSNAPLSIPILAAQPTQQKPPKETDDDDEDDVEDDEMAVEEEQEEVVTEDLAPALSQLGLLQPIVNHMASKLSIVSPTAVQALAVPALLTPTTPFDAILRAQTGSGKTLAFLLPLVQDLLSLSSPSNTTRSIGTLAIVLSPTRELASQTYNVLESLLSLPSSSQIFSFPPRALTPCLLVGGANRTHEKRRLRKGCPIVVATPGRLLDHLRTTECFKLAGEPEKTRGPKGKPGNANHAALGVRGARKVALRWLVIDECDRLMDLGFEEQMKGVMEELERRSPSGEMGALEGGRRRTVLCSATAGEGVERLMELTVKNPKTLSVDKDDSTVVAPPKSVDDPSSSAVAGPGTAFTAPSQLIHNYVVVPPKLRFVTLVAHLRRLLSPSSKSAKSTRLGPDGKVLVFLSCTAAVDFYWEALGSLSMSSASATPDEPATNVVESAKDRVTREKAELEAEKTKLVSMSSLLPKVEIYRLHGNMELNMRLGSLGGFSGTGGEGKGKGGLKVLLCTSVAARGLDVAGVGHVVQYDLPTEGGVTEYIHRAGRTARAGAQGQATSLLLPSETDWVPWVEAGMRDAEKRGPKDLKMRQVGVEDVLSEGFGGEGREYETRATDVQMGFERWVAESDENSTQARNAFASHIRAYATHPSAEKHMFNTKVLHLGHLAKSFGMREAPSGAPKPSKKSRAASAPSTGRTTKSKPLESERNGGASFETGRKFDEERAKMRNAKKTMMGPTGGGASEFQVADSSMLSELARQQSQGSGKKRKY